MDEFIKSMSGRATGILIIYLLKYLSDLVFKHTEKSIEHKYDRNLVEIEKNNSFDKIKFEQAHLKRIQILEKLNLEIGNLFAKINSFCLYKNCLAGLCGKDFKENEYWQIKFKIDDLSGYMNFAKLYLRNCSAIIDKVNNLINSFELFVNDFYKDFNDSESNKFLGEIEKIKCGLVKSIDEINGLSHDLINISESDLKLAIHTQSNQAAEQYVYKGVISNEKIN